MRAHTSIRTALCTLLLASAWLCVDAIPNLLVFTKTSPGAYRHDSIPTAVDVITRLGTGALRLNSSNVDPSLDNSAAKWRVTHSEDDSLWVSNANYLDQFDAVAFVSTSDQNDGSTSLLSNAAKARFAQYIQQGGGFVGVHNAAGSLFTTPFYGRLVGAYFDYHPEIQQVGIRALTTSNPSTSRFPDPLTINEEVYHFRTDPRALPSAPTVLLSNATAFQDPQAASRNRSDGPPPRPLAWVREGRLLDAPSQALGEGMDDPSGGPTYAGGPGRMFYTSLGHLNQTWMQGGFQGHIAGGIAWVLSSSTVRSNNASAVVGQAASNTTSSTGSSTGNGSIRSAMRQTFVAWYAVVVAIFLVLLTSCTLL